MGGRSIVVRLVAAASLTERASLTSLPAAGWAHRALKPWGQQQQPCCSHPGGPAATSRAWITTHQSNNPVLSVCLLPTLTSCRSFCSSSQAPRHHTGSSDRTQLTPPTGSRPAPRTRHRNQPTTSNATALSVAQDRISSGELLQLIHAAQQVQQLQVLLLQYGDVWSAPHVAAAFQRLPHLTPHLYNARAAQLSTLQLLCQGLSRVLDHLQPSQLVFCLLCLGRFHYAPPAVVEALCSRLVQQLGAAAAEPPLSALLSTAQWARCAQALALVEVVRKEPGQRGGAWGHHRVVPQSRGAWMGGPVSEQGDPGHHHTASRAGAESTWPANPTSSNLGGNSSSPADSKSAAGVGAGDAGVLPPPTAIIQGQGHAADALAASSPVEQLWLLVFKGSLGQLDNFSANDAAAWCWALVRRGRWPQEAVTATFRSLRLRPHKLEPQHAVQVLLAAVEADAGNPEQFEVLLKALGKQRGELSLQLITRTLELMAARQHYIAPLADELCSASLHHIKGSTAQHVVQLAGVLAELGHYHMPLFKAICKRMVGHMDSLPSEDLAQLLWAVLQLHHSGPGIHPLAAAAVDALNRRSKLDALAPEASIKLLWACAVLGSGSAPAQEQLLKGLQTCSPQEVPRPALCLLHQALQLMQVNGARLPQHEQQQQQQQPVSTHKTQQQGGKVGPPPPPPPAAAADSDEDDDEGDLFSTSLVIHDASATAAPQVGGSSSIQQQQQDQPHSRLQPAVEGALMDAAAAAATIYARRVASGSKRQRQQISQVMEQLGLQPLQLYACEEPQGVIIDLAVADSQAAAAVLCSGARYSRSQPRQLLGYWGNAVKLLQQQGWRVVELPPHEWGVLVGQDGDEAAAMAALGNKLLEQGLSL